MLKTRMRLVLTIIIIFIYSNSKAQKVTEDSLIKVCIEGFENVIQDIPEYAAKSFSKIIAIDSSYYKVYFLRAMTYLRDAEHPVSDSTGKLNHEYNDSLLIRKSIEDLKKSIYLYLFHPKTFPENYIGFEEEYEMPKKTKEIVLGERVLSNKNQNIIDGVMVYMTSHGKNKNLACECWKKAKTEKVYKIEILINEFCK